MESADIMKLLCSLGAEYIIKSPENKFDVYIYDINKFKEQIEIIDKNLLDLCVFKELGRLVEYS